MKPRSTTQNSFFAGFRSSGISHGIFRVVVQPVVAPLPRISMHVRETPRIGNFATRRMGLLQAIAAVPSVVCDFCRIISEAVSRAGPSSACIFPFSFRWQTIAASCRFFRREILKTFAKLGCLRPCKRINSTVWFTELRLFSHHCLILLFCNFGASQTKRLANRYLVHRQFPYVPTP